MSHVQFICKVYVALLSRVPKYLYKIILNNMGVQFYCKIELHHAAKKKFNFFVLEIAVT